MDPGFHLDCGADALVPADSRQPEELRGLQCDGSARSSCAAHRDPRWSCVVIDPAASTMALRALSRTASNTCASVTVRTATTRPRQARQCDSTACHWGLIGCGCGDLWRRNTSPPEGSILSYAGLCSRPLASRFRHVRRRPTRRGFRHQYRIAVLTCARTRTPLQPSGQQRLTRP